LSKVKSRSPNKIRNKTIFNSSVYGNSNKVSDITNTKYVAQLKQKLKNDKNTNENNSNDYIQSHFPSFPINNEFTPIG